MGIMIGRVGFCCFLLIAGVGSTHAATWRQLMKQVDALQEKDQYSQALPLAEQAVELARNTFGPESVQMAASLEALADVYEGLNDYDRALPLYEGALKIRETKLGPNHRDVAEPLRGLANLYEDLGRYAEAEPLYLRALRIFEKVRGPNHPQVAKVVYYLAWLYDDQGRYTEAAALYERALAIDEKHFGPNHPEVATDLNGLAIVYEELGRYADAERLYQRALRIREKKLGPDHPDVASSLAGLGRAYTAQGRYAEAEKLDARALQIHEKRLGPDHPDVAVSAEYLAADYEVEGRYGEAEKLYQRSLAIDEKTFGPNHPRMAASLNDLARICLSQARYAEATQFSERARDVYEKALGPDHPDVARSLEMLAITYRDQGRYAEAEPLLKRSLTINEKVLGATHPDVATSVTSLAALYMSEGRYAEAEPLYERALGIREKAFGAEHPDTATALSSAAVLRAWQGRYPEAESLARRALAIREKALGTQHPDVAFVLVLLASLYQDQGRYTEAKPLYDRALQIREKTFGPNHPAVADSLDFIAGLYRAQGRYADAAPVCERALAIREAVLGAEHPDTATSAVNLGLVYFRQDRYADAEKLYLRALAVREKVLGPEHSVTGIALHNLALLYWKQGRNAEAEPLFRRALAIDEKVWGPNHPLSITALFNLASVRFALKDFQDAQALFRRGFDNVFRQLQYSFAYMGETERLELLSMMDYNFSSYFSLVEAYPDDAAAGAMYDLLLWQKGLVANSIVALRRRVAARGDPEALKLLDQLSALHTRIAQLSNPAAAGQTAGRPGQYSATLVALDEQARQTEIELVKRSGEGQAQPAATWQDLRKALEPGAAAVEFVRYYFYDGGPVASKSHYAALVLTPDSTAGPRFVPLGDAAAIEGRPFEEYRQWIASPDDGQPSSPAPAAPSPLYEAVWKPLESVLGDTHTVYVSPDGILSQVSLGVLASSGGRLLTDRYDLRVVSSTRDMLARANPPQADSAVLVGNPDFLLTDKEQLKAISELRGVRREDNAVPVIVAEVMRRSGAQGVQRGGCDASEVPIHGVSCPLPGTKEEVEAIYDLLKAKGWQVEPPSEGPGALEEVVKGVHHPRVLHLATHGYFKQDQAVKDDASVEAAVLGDPMLHSGLLFAGVDRILNGETPLPGVDGGMLTALEASGLDLQGTELVVLSACETGLGKYRAGEGVFGLQRAFAEAGAGSILMSMWKVPDESTQALMTAFYTNWLSGMEKHQALLEAQRKIRETSPSPISGARLCWWAGEGPAPARALSSVARRHRACDNFPCR